MMNFKGLKDNVTIRFFIIGFLILAMLVPMMMVRGVIEDRGQYYNLATAGVRDGWADAQSLAGPFLVIPYSYRQELKTYNKELEKHETTLVDRTGHLYILPEKTEVKADFAAETRKRGLFNVPIYSATIAITGTIRIPELKTIVPPDHLLALQLLQPYLGLKLSDPRGLFGDLALRFDGKGLDPQPGTQLASISGIHAPLGTAIRSDAAQSYNFDLSFKLKGTENFSYIPLARQADLRITSNWPHPSFGGRFLPATHSITDTGFTADWSVSALATNIEEKFAQCADGSQCETLDTTNISVGFFENVNLYAKALRSTKYGVLFLGLTFTAFFMFEVLRRFRIHPIQYLMVGGALTIFYLLLLALAEHIGFGPAYGLASLAVCMLLGYYIAHIVSSARAGGLFGFSILVLYALLYGILGSEDYALLMGTALLFTVLAAAMILTRKVNWYALGTDAGKEDGGP